MEQSQPAKLNLSLTPGTYVVAVSGGVDSMVLLDLLRRPAARSAGLELVVAHLDHGARADSAEDRRLVQKVARQHGLPFVYQEARLGAGVSEAAARTARYAFLRQARRDSGARAVVTAHHQDDVLETAIINLLRGTGRRGLTALSDRPDLRRPLLGVPKTELLAYAEARGLAWREDSTNQDQAYLRNYVRQRLLSRFDAAARQRLLQLINDLRPLNDQIDALLVNYLHLQGVGGQLERTGFNQLSHSEARETLAAWLRACGVRDFDRPALERLVVVAKTGRAGSRHDVRQGVQLGIASQHLALHGPER